MEIENKEIDKKQVIKEDEYIRLFKICKTVYKMLEDRGYIVNKEPEMDNFDEFKEKFKFREELSMLVENNYKELIYLEFSSREKLTVEDIKDIGVRLFHKDIKNGILISKGPPTTLCKNSIQDIAENKIFIEVFEEKELLVNITEHELVPKHIILSEEDKKLLLEKYKLKESQLPKILLTDPIAKYLGLKRSQVVKIIRPSETAGKYITYRIAQ